MVWLLGIVFYTVISAGFFLYNMGMKDRKDRWYDWPLMLPALAIIYLISWSSKALDTVTKVAHKLKMCWIYFRNPEIKEIVKLSGKNK